MERCAASCKEVRKTKKEETIQAYILGQSTWTAISLLPSSAQNLATHSAAALGVPPVTTIKSQNSESCLHFGQYGQRSLGEISQEQLSYVRTLDAVTEEDRTWKVAQMVGHKEKKHCSSSSLIAWVDWFTGPSPWVEFQALKSHHLYAMI